MDWESSISTNKASYVYFWQPFVIGKSYKKYFKQGYLFPGAFVGTLTHGFFYLSEFQTLFAKGKYLFTVNNKNTRITHLIFQKLVI